MSEQWSEWYEWNGGKCPVPNDAEVHVVFRCGIEKIRLANELRWSHNVGAYFYFHGDIIRYRVKLPQKAVVDKLAIMETALRAIAKGDGIPSSIAAAALVNAEVEKRMIDRPQRNACYIHIPKEGDSLNVGDAQLRLNPGCDLTVNGTLFIDGSGTIEITGDITLTTKASEAKPVKKYKQVLSRADVDLIVFNSECSRAPGDKFTYVNVIYHTERAVLRNLGLLEE